jgi:predicted nucleic acid-binding protein
MIEGNSRFDPKQIFDSDWRKRAWKGWLRSRWLGAEDAKPTPPEKNSPATLAPPSPVPQATGIVTATNPVRDAEARRRDLRTRFDEIADKLGGVEDSIESLVKRFALNSVHQRRHEQRLFERIEGSSEMLERQTLALEAMQTSVERIEQRVERLERRLRSYENRTPSNSFESNVTETRAARTSMPRDEYDDFADFEDALSETVPRAPQTLPPEAFEATDGAGLSGPSIHGNLSEMSLGTVLAMLELERRTGLLQVTSEEGSCVTATLRAGAIVGARRREVEADPVEVVREALRYKNGLFWFRQSSVEIVSGPPRSVGSVLLEASSRNDEAARTG